MELAYHILLNLILILRTVFGSMVVEDVRAWLVLMLEDSEVLDAGVVLIEGDCDLSVEGGVVAGHVGLD